MAMRHRLSLAFTQGVVRRSLKVGLVVGTILALINYTDRVLAGNMASVDWLKLLLTYLVPYSVSTYASVSERLQQAK